MENSGQMSKCVLLFEYYLSDDNNYSVSYPVDLAGTVRAAAAAVATNENTYVFFSRISAILKT